MGKTYLYECPRCAYRAQVSGRADRGFGVCVETIACGDCKRLYDVVVRLRVAQELETRVPSGRKADKNGKASTSLSTQNGPNLPAALNRLTLGLGRNSQWLDFKPRCPVSPLHRVKSWSDTEKCPRCGTELERSGLPYRIWD